MIEYVVIVIAMIISVLGLEVFFAAADRRIISASVIGCFLVTVGGAIGTHLIGAWQFVSLTLAIYFLYLILKRRGLFDMLLRRV